MLSAGFFAVGENAYSFVVWYSEPYGQTRNTTVSHVWSSNTISLSSSMLLFLNNTGNLVLRQTESIGVVLWLSFDFPTDTLLPQQVFTRHAKLVFSRSKTNKSLGFYTLFFDNKNILHLLLYDGPEVSGL
ncbi:hypothetical protein JHK84_047462 [Glycine max]|uniref:Bulb-type lectin domain-containing protein n=1 Tax=Glycine max TaxID=3847 RepID=K7MLQ7_SOYBN|nr:hypothetical protein JHK86_047441 [Glycine max]KAG4943384.1 hypothetical protein JHK85_048030 [Glycine max]KAG5102493.1 hypothetical protein JHK84_047462 [Glycine max]